MVKHNMQVRFGYAHIEHEELWRITHMPKGRDTPAPYHAIDIVIIIQMAFMVVIALTALGYLSGVIQ